MRLNSVFNYLTNQPINYSTNPRVTYDIRMIIVCVIFELHFGHTKEYRYDTKNFPSKTDYYP